MKVVIVAPHFYPRIGGVETYTLNIATRLVTLGWQVVVISASTTQGDDTVAGIPVHRLPVAMTISNTPVGFRWRRELARIFDVERPDVINAHTPVPFLADMAERASGSIPFVLTYHNDLVKDAPLAKAAVTLLQRTLIDRTLRRSTRIIATSDYYVRESRYLHRYESKISVVPPGVDLAVFNPDVRVDDDLAAAYSGRRVILFVGSLNLSQRHKGLDLLISAFARLRARYQDLCLVVVGTGDGTSRYQAMAAEAGVAEHVTFTGYLPDEQLAQHYKLASVFAMPSTDRSEGFGMVYAEAGAVGTPVVGSRIGGVPYAVKDEESGLLVSPRDAGDLDRALARLLDDAALARRLGDAAAARARAEFDWHCLARRTSEVLGRGSV